MKILYGVLLIALILSIACGGGTGEPAPTAVPVDLDATVEAKVKAVLTAVPTIAPTPVPAPTASPVVVPTSVPAATAFDPAKVPTPVPPRATATRVIPTATTPPAIPYSPPTLTPTPTAFPRPTRTPIPPNPTAIMPTVTPTAPTPTPLPLRVPTAIPPIPTPTPTPTAFPTPTPTPANEFNVTFDPSYDSKFSNKRQNISIYFPNRVTLEKATLTVNGVKIDILVDFHTADHKHLMFIPVNDFYPGQYTISVTATDYSGNIIGPVSSIFIVTGEGPTVPTAVQSQSGHSGSSGSDSQNTSDELPKLQNLLIKKLGPYDAANATFGAFKYKNGFDKLVFDFFGMIHNPGQPNQYDNPTFEFKAPADTILISPISGIITKIDWQPTGTSYKQDDWDLYISPTENSAVVVNVDHIVSIDCDRTGHTPVTCDKPLRIDGQIASKGMAVEAGQVIGYVGNWVDYNNVGINGRTELTLFKYIREGDVKTDQGVMNYCPTMHLAADIEASFKSLITELMETYETWSGDMSTYSQEYMVAPGCIYEAIKEVDAKTEPVLD